MRKTFYIKTSIMLLFVAFFSSCGLKATVNTPVATVTIDSNHIISPETLSRLEQVFAFDLPGSFINMMVFLPDGSALITADSNGEILQWDRATWTKTALIPSHQDTSNDTSGVKKYFAGTTALSPDGETLVNALGENGEVTGYDLKGVELFTFDYNSPVYAVSISRDGKFAAFAGEAGNVIIFDLKTRKQVANLVSDHSYVSSLVFSPDSIMLVVSYERPENVIKTWDTNSWQETDSFSHVTHRTDYHDVIFSPDGAELVIATIEDTEIVFWDLAARQITRELSEHTRAPYQVTFSPDGRLLASAADDGTVRLWNMSTGARIKIIQTNLETGTVAFSPDGTLLAFSVWGQGGIRVWGIAP
jgi:WD40 repeat protein